MNNEQFRALLTILLPKFKRFHVTIRDLIEDNSSNKIVVWASSEAETVAGQPYGNEYMLMLHFNETGNKVTSFMEFVDSAYTLGFIPKPSDKPEAASK
jgi:ketosteroid isomerase-like protein